MLDEKTLSMFRKWGAKGGRARAKKYTREQISRMARKRKNGKRR